LWWRRVLVVVSPCSCGGDAIDGPADLCSPRRGVVGVAWTTQVPLPYRSSHGEGVLDHPAAQLAVGDVDRVVVAGMRGHRQLRGGQGDGVYAPGRVVRLGDRQVDQGVTPAGGEQFVVVQPAGWAGRC